MSYYNWQKATKADKLKFRKASPNLVELKEWMIKRFGGTSVGIFHRRPVRGGTAPSSHSFGAALDWRYTRRDLAEQAMNWIVRNHLRLGVQVIFDYVGCRQWVVGQGWKQMKPNPKTGVGESWAKWLHIETTRTKWGDKTPIEQRL